MCGAGHHLSLQTVLDLTVPAQPPQGDKSDEGKRNVLDHCLVHSALAGS